jgi:hypothetical protein
MAELVNSMGVVAYELGDTKTYLQQFERAYAYAQTRRVDVFCNLLFGSFIKATATALWKESDSRSVTSGYL